MRHLKSNPVAVLISDVHYSLSTLELADLAFRLAIAKASELNVPLIDAGDLTNDKALLRGEVMNRLIATMKHAKLLSVKVGLIVGNHSLLNEKGKAHALGFLAPYVSAIIDSPQWFCEFYCIPYQSTPEDFERVLDRVPKGTQLIIHQGVTGSAAGHYIQDHSAVAPGVLEGYKSVGGHYHTRQSIGNHSFIGNPYTLTFAEANDPDKGFQILYDDGSLELVRTNLRQHYVVDMTFSEVADWLGLRTFPKVPANFLACRGYDPHSDLLWLKVRGTRLELDKIAKEDLSKRLGGSKSFKLDLIPTNSEAVHMDQKEAQTDSALMDALIDASGESTEEQEALKALYKEILC